jgi:hypothetical protein
MKSWSIALISLLFLFGCMEPSLEGKDIRELGALNMPVKCSVSFSYNNSAAGGSAYILGDTYLLDFNKSEGVGSITVYTYDILVENETVYFIPDNNDVGAALMKGVTGCWGFRLEGQDAQDYLGDIEISLSNCSKGEFDNSLFEIDNGEFCTSEEYHQRMQAIVGS